MARNFPKCLETAAHTPKLARLREPKDTHSRNLRQVSSLDCHIGDSENLLKYVSL